MVALVRQPDIKAGLGQSKGYSMSDTATSAYYQSNIFHAALICEYSLW